MSDKEMHDVILSKLNTIDSKVDNLIVQVAGHEPRIKAIENKLDTGNRSERVAAAVSVICLVITIVTIISTVFMDLKSQEKERPRIEKVK